MLERECNDHQSSLRPPFTPRHEEKINPAGPASGEVPLKHEEEAKSSGLRSLILIQDVNDDEGLQGVNRELSTVCLYRMRGLS
jgi:hypothetical protein